jgi:hypothetical protein
MIFIIFSRIQISNQSEIFMYFHFFLLAVNQEDLSFMWNRDRTHNSKKLLHSNSDIYN